MSLTVGELQANLGLDDRQFNRGVASAKRSMSGLASDADKAGQQIGSSIGGGISAGLKVDKNGRLRDELGRFVQQSDPRWAAFYGKEGEKLGDSLTDGVTRSTHSGMSKIAKGIATATVGGGLALFAFAKSATDAASDLNESASKSAVVFGDANAAVVDFASQGARSLGISKQAALEAAATYGNLFRAMGIGQGKAADMSTALVGLARDLASFNNADPSEVMDALRSGLTGEVEPLRKFGVNLNDDRLKAEAMRLGLVKTQVSAVDLADKTNKVNKALAAQQKALKENGRQSQQYKDATIEVSKAQDDLNKLTSKVPDTLDAAQKAQAAYSLIMQDTSLAQGDFARTADGAANKQRILSAQFEDTKAKLGEMLLPIENWTLETVISGLQGLSDWWDEHGPGIRQWFTDTFGQDPGANFKSGIDVIKGKGQELVDWWTENIGTFSDLKNGLNELHRLAGDNSNQLNEQSGIVETAASAWDVFNKSVGPEGVGGRLLWLKDEVLDPLWGSLQEGSGIFVDTYNFLHDLLGPAIQQNLIDPMQQAWDVIQFGKDHVLDPLIGTLQTIVGFLNDITTNPIGSIHDIGRQLGIPGFDTGGIVPGAIGAPRLILAHGGETVLPTHKRGFGAMNDNSRTFSPTIIVNGQPNPAESARMASREMNRQAFYAGVG